MKISNRTINQLKKNYEGWVLITGASSGIGRSIAHDFAYAGFNLIITGRREKLLHELSTELFDKFKTEVISMVGDLSSREHINELIAETGHLPISILVLNAGFGTSGKFVDNDLNEELNLIDLNIKAVTILSHEFAQRMRNKQTRSAIILMSSMVAFQGVPNAANYAASKAYIQAFGEALSLEMKDYNIDVLCVAPGPVNSGFASRAKMKLSNALQPKVVSSSILNSIGKRTTILPGTLTKFLVYNLRMVPRWAKVMIMGQVMAGFTKHRRS